MVGHQRLATVIPLPPPSPTHATCPWCPRRFTTIVDLLDHVDARHLPARPLVSTDDIKDSADDEPTDRAIDATNQPVLVPVG